MSRMTAFNDNYDDLSTEAGFQFVFKCDLCDEGYKTGFVESKTYKKGRFFKGIGSLVGGAADLLGQSGIGQGVDAGSRFMSEKFDGMTPEWHKEHEKAFNAAQEETRGRFQRCPRCKQFVCNNDWNEECSLCVDCAPRESVEIAAARAEKMVEDIKAKTQETQVFSGEINARQALCPSCKKPAGGGKFCSSCGASLEQKRCGRCGSQNASGAAFCSECGNKLG